ncbi:MAG TPA: M14 family metallopeptidase, partial [Actinomycetota bacterium]|nr:M14 family metallopeptidase [Actinomycetota bacterium]
MRNHRRAGLPALTVVIVLASLVTTVGAQERGQGETERSPLSGAQLPPAAAVASGKPGTLKVFEATVDASTLQGLVNQGYDVTPVEDTLDGIVVALVLSPGEQRVLEAKGVELTLQSAPNEREARVAAASQSIFGFDVFRSYDEPGGIEDQLLEIGANPQYQGFVKLYDIGDTVEGRDILAIRMTQGARGRPLGSRPAVLYQGTTHAREWISTEVTMRLLEWFLAERRAENPDVVEILETSELWFVPVVNPDGYEFTFTDERLWRKNLQDNDDNGIINSADGVDLNRNYPNHWRWEDDRSSSVPSNETYRGDAPGSEPETQSSMGLVQNMADFKFAISYHSFGQLLLYAQGWQTLTPSADDPIYVALSGTDDDPAIADFNPGVGADLYTTNGEFTDWAHATEGVLAWTP